MITINFKVKNMICTSCEETIVNELSKMKSIKKVEADFICSTVKITYDNKLLNEKVIQDKLSKLGYPTTSNNNFNTNTIIFLSIFAVIIILLSKFNFLSFNMDTFLEGGSLLLIFILGVFSSFHCIGMCGGIMLTQSFGKNSTIKTNIFYNLGRVLSYTLLGGFIGALGSVFSINTTIKGVIQILASIFMIISAINLLDIPYFKKLNLYLPRFINLKGKSTNPFVVGLLNGFMPCGPLQTMQLYALSTGSFYLGALSMFAFSIGTVPLMLSFGAIASFLSKKRSKEILKFSGIFLLVLAISMFGRGLRLLPIPGVSFNNSEISSNLKPTIVNGVQEITITANSNGYNPKTIYVQKDMPVKIKFEADSISFCTNRLVIPDLNKEVALSTQGTQIVEFTPNATKNIKYSCWMGMKGGNIQVVDNLNTITTDRPANNYNPDDYDTSKYNFDYFNFPSGASCH